jgi:two-component system, chemotaxis family, protein-glutamate methylesterase/glutaminase
MPADGWDGAAAGYVCPQCGGVVQERPGGGGQPSASDRVDALRFECRIGHRYEAAQLWMEHCAARNRALQQAARALAENAALARRLAGWTREQGNLEAAVELEREAAAEDRLYEQVRHMVEGLPEPGRGGSL